LTTISRMVSATNRSDQCLPPNRFPTWLILGLSASSFYALLSPYGSVFHRLDSADVVNLLMKSHSVHPKLPSLPMHAWILALLVVTLVLVIIAELSENHEDERFRPSDKMLAMEVEAANCEAESTSGEESAEEEDAARRGHNSQGEMIWREEQGKSVLVPKFFLPTSAKKKGKSTPKRYKLAEVAKHNTKEDCWIVIESRVYNVTKFIDHHPGGWLPIVNMGGKDCTDAFANYHPASVYRKSLPSFYIGDCVDTLDEDAFTKEHREIRQILLRRGLFETNNMYYALKIIWLSSVFCASMALSLDSNASKSTHLFGGLLLAVFWQQLAFVGHDIGHNSMSHKKWKETFLGILFGNTFGGISLGWWKRSHNVHHIVCNSVEHDPDIQHPPVFAVSDECFDTDKLAEGAEETDAVVDREKGFWSTYHEKWMTLDRLWQFLVCYQHWLFYPIMAVARFNLYAQGIVFIINCKKQDGWHAKNFHSLEAATMFLFLSGMSYVLLQLPPDERLAYALISHGFSGLLHVQICISHFTMDTYHGHAYNDASDEWFRMQLFTTMNVDSWRWMDFFHGGLQFQIEHHLYPRLPRHNLREARELVKPLCEKWDIHYHEPGFIAANVELIESMKATALKCRKYGLKAIGGKEETSLYEGLNAEG